MVSPGEATWYSDVEGPVDVEDPDALAWDDQVDVAVVGFGGAGACAAIEAAERGASVMVIDRFTGGGATVVSGGVFYAGGGTPQQEEAGVEDTPEEMYKYLSLETKGCVEDATLRAFCQESRENLLWLEKQGVPFEGSLCPHKTSYPTNRYRLYYSGNETIAQYCAHARPAPRGHVAKGKKGLRAVAGPALFRPLKESAIRKGVLVRLQSKVKRLVRDAGGRVVGLEFDQIPQGTIWAWLHRVLASAETKLYRFVPPVGNILRSLFSLIETRKATRRRVRVRKGVILASGGFIFNRRMVETYAPKYKAGLPLGTSGDDGSGIRLGESVGGATDKMERVSAWRFINPPLAWSEGIIVNAEGERYCDEMVYGSVLGERMCEDQQGKAILILDRELFRRALREILPWKVMPFQWMAAASNMFMNAKKARTLEDLARACKIPAAKLRATVEAYRAAARGEVEDPFGKERKYIHPFGEGPYYAMDVSVDSRLYPCPTITFGGLVVEEQTGRVRRADGSTIPGLYAAGRTAVGLASGSYVSGLSIADCVFSGRRAGQHAAMSEG